MRLTTVPEHVMRSGAISVFDPRNARAGAQSSLINAMTRTAVGREPGKVTPGGIFVEQSDVSPSSGTMLGQDASGRSVRQFDVPGMPSSAQAARAVSALKETADLVRRRGLATAVTPLVSGPLAALASGEAVVIRFTNGVAIQAAL